MNKQLNTPKLKVLFLIGFLILALSICPSEESRADSPAYDPWYYVHKDTYKFAVPDKFQHFWGSAALTEAVGPMPALALGITKEVYDDQYAKVGFSVRDIVADVLGIMSTKLARSEKVFLWLDWNPREEAIVLRFGLTL